MFIIIPRLIKLPFGKQTTAAVTKQTFVVSVLHECAFVKPERRIKSVTEVDKSSNHINHKSWKRERNTVQVTPAIYKLCQ